MKFALDTAGRFVLTAKEGGWDLIVNDEAVFYCHHPVEAVQYLGEQLREEDMAVGIEGVIEALARVESQVQKAVETTDLYMAANIIVPIIMRLASAALDKKQVLKDVSLRLAGCTEQELRVRDDRYEIVHKAKTILEPWFQAQGLT